MLRSIAKVASVSLLAASAALGAGAPVVVPLWPNGAPGFEDRKDWKEVEVKGKVTGIHNPSITAYLPPQGQSKGAAVIIAPGGGNRFLLIHAEGYDLAQWLADRGVAGFVLKYRLASDDAGPAGYKVEIHALADIQRAIRLVRSRSAEWRLNPNRIGVLGFSAGGEIAALASLRFDAGSDGASDPVERESSQPDFQALIYPSLPPGDFAFPKDTPPAFLLCAADDEPKAAPLAGYFLKLRSAGISAELHIYNRGGHGFGMRNRPIPVSTWPSRLFEWMGDVGMLPCFGEATVWAHHEDAIPSYFVYGLTATAKGTLLAFSEARFGSDEAPHHLALKRSTDGGRSWSGTRFIERADGSYWNEHGHAGKLECWANPAAIADRKTGRVFVFYALNEGQSNGRNSQRYTKNFYKYSDDDGVTWSERVDVTDLLNVKADGTPNMDQRGNRLVDGNGFPCDDLGRAFHMPGPGHGLQLQNGRILIQFWNRTALGTRDGPIPTKARRYGICLLYSDDSGRSWHPGPRIGEKMGSSESRTAELAGGELYLNARTEYSAARSQRGILRSADQGLTWRPEGYDRAMPPYYRVDSGLTEVQAGGREILLLSHCGSSEERRELVVSASLDGGKSWALHRVINEEGASYSDLVTLPDGTVGLLYGKGRPLDQVSFIRFNLAWLGL